MSARASRSTKRVPTVSNVDSEMSDSATTNIPAPAVNVPVEETNIDSAPVAEKKVASRKPKEMSPEETEFIASVVEFLNQEGRTDSFWKIGFHDVIAVAVKNGPKNYAGKIAATAADAAEANIREVMKATVSAGASKKERAPRKPSNQKVFKLNPAFAALLESKEIGDLTIAKVNEKVSDSLISIDGNVGLTKPRALQIIWTIFGNYLKTATNAKGEATYPKDSNNKSYATWESADMMKALPKELQKFLKASKEKSLSLTGGQAFITAMCLTADVIGTHGATEDAENAE